MSFQRKSQDEVLAALTSHMLFPEPISGAKGMGHSDGSGLDHTPLWKPICEVKLHLNPRDQKQRMMVLPGASREWVSECVSPGKPRAAINTPTCQQPTQYNFTSCSHWCQGWGSTFYAHPGSRLVEALSSSTLSFQGQPGLMISTGLAGE